MNDDIKTIKEALEHALTENDSGDRYNDYDGLYYAIEKAVKALAALGRVEMAGWQLFNSAPEDGTEILVVFPQQGNVMLLVNYNRIHGYWESKGKPKIGLEHQGCLWQHKPTAPISGTAEGE